MLYVFYLLYRVSEYILYSVNNILHKVYEYISNRTHPCQNLSCQKESDMKEYVYMHM